MGLLIDQFIESLEEWSKRTRTPNWGWASEVLLWTGGAWREKPVEAVDPKTVPEGRRKPLSVVEKYGHFTLEQVRTDLEGLVDLVHVQEDFLIVSLVHALERQLEGLSEEYAKGLRRRRQFAEHIESILGDPALLEFYLRQMNEQREEGQDPATEATVISMAERFRQWSVPSLEEQRDRRTDLETWRTVTAPLLDPKNLRRFRRAREKQWGLPPLPEDENDDGS